ncbi:hypothetical protein CHLRE_13g574750v5 [Chlamydomonas reinhardtii]|uniref:Mediator complex subunit 15 KIX domain-containing protein n=1 Tax=Chlamydomonas reinhardtii TaxID=3055 RepID=A0A2K3CZW7_CHLRE|nr:uncharacterized protein CHLRE_13g574750v5 [Chlamydomonas reinhardtii]PNW73834.1 hypothetical protein CHLRE_13g574750v5 [Chlamydomonas reinhardtii]
MASVISDEKRKEWRQYGLNLLMQSFGNSKFALKLAAVVDRAEDEAFKACSTDQAVYEATLRKKLDKSRDGISKMLQQHAHTAMAQQQQQQQHQQMQQRQPVPMVNQQPPQMMQVPQHMISQPQPPQVQQAPMEPAPEQNDDGALFNDFLGTFVNAGGAGAGMKQQQQQQAQQHMMQQAYGAQQQQPGGYPQQPQTAARPGQAPTAGYPMANVPVPVAGRALAPPPGFPGSAVGAVGAPGGQEAQSVYGGGGMGAGGMQVPGQQVPGMGMPTGAGVPMQGQHPGALQGQHAPNMGMAGGMPGQQVGYGGMPGQAPAHDPAAMAATAAAAVQQQQQQQQQHMNAAQAQYVQVMQQQQQQQQQAAAVAAAAVQQQQHQMAAARMASGATSPPPPGGDAVGLAAAAAAANARKPGMPGAQTAQASRPAAMQVPSPVPTAPAYTAPGALGPQAGAAAPAAPGAQAAEEPANQAALEQEYWRLVAQLKTRQHVLRAQIEKYAKADDMKASRSRRILLEAYKRCTVEPGSAEAANYPISGNTLKLLSAVLSSLDGAGGRARALGAPGTAPAQPIPPSLAEGGATNTPPTAPPPPAPAAPVAIKQEPGVAAAGASAPAAGSSGTSRAAIVAAAAVQGAVRRSIKIPRPGQSKAGAGAAEGGGATAGVAAAGTAAAIQPKQEAETGAKPGVPAKLERSSDSASPAVDQVTRLLGLLAQPLPAATLRAHSSRGAADALNFDWDSLMPSLPAAACAQLTAAAAAATTGPPAGGPSSRPAICARTVSVCRVAGLSYEAARAPDGPGSSLHGQASVATAGGLEGMRTQSLGSRGTSCNSLTALGVARVAISLAAAAGTARRGAKRPAQDGTTDVDGDAAAQAATPELKRRRAALETVCAEAEEELKGAVSLRLLEGELCSVSGLEPDAWLVECAAVDLSGGGAAGASAMDEDGHHGNAAAAGGAAGATGAASGAPWRRLRLCVPWDYPHSPPVPTFSSSDPAYSHPYGRAARLHFQTALQGAHHHHHHDHSPHHSLLSLARAWRDAVVRVSNAVRAPSAAAAGPASHMPHSLTPSAIAV